MLGIDDYKLIDAIIAESPNQKVFTFIDFGAGNCLWGDRLADHLNKLKNIDEDVEFKIISTVDQRLKKEHITHDRGHAPELLSKFSQQEDFSLEKIHFEKIGKCSIYKLAQFKSEDCLKAFKELDLDLVGEVDFIVSNYSIRSMLDRVGTSAQLFKMLKVGKGYIASDGFGFPRNSEDGKAIYSDSIAAQNKSAAHLLSDSDCSYITSSRYQSSERNYAHFLVKKGEKELNLSNISYGQLEEKKTLGNSHYIQHYVYKGDKKVNAKIFLKDFVYGKSTPEKGDDVICVPILGSKDLFGWCKKHDLFIDNSAEGAPEEVCYVGEVVFDEIG